MEPEELREELMHGLKAFLETHANVDANMNGPANMVDGLFAIAEAIYAVARAIER